MAKAHRKSKARASRSARPRKSRPRAKPESASRSTAIVPVVTPAPIIVQGTRVRELRRDEIELLQRTVAKGTSQDEFALFLWVARKHKLDPLTRQLHCVMRSVSKHHQDEKGIWVGGEQMTIQMGIDGYRSLAGRDHKDFGGCDEPEFEFDSAVAGKKKIPVKATIRLWKKGLEHPVVGVAYWDEYAPADLTKPQAFMWSKMPKHMLAKCAEALAIRKGYPELADIYTDEEMHQADQDYSASGRQLVDGQGMSPSGLPVSYDARKRGEVNAEVDRQLAEHKANREALDAKNATEGVPGAAWKREHEKNADIPPVEPKTPVERPRRRETASQTVAQGGGTRPAAASEARNGAPQGTVEVDWADPQSPIVRGDIGNLVELIQKHCKATWRQDWWHILPADVPTIKEMCKEFGYEVKEVSPSKASGGVRHDLPEKTTATGRGSGGEATQQAAAPAVVSGVIERVNSGMAGKAPVKYVTLILADKTKPTYGCFDKKLFDSLEAGRGLLVHFQIEKRGQYSNIVRVLKIGSKEFDEHGLPVIQVKDREAGTKTLF